MPLAAFRERLRSSRLAGVLLLEALVVFLGITASFWMEEWREQRQDRETYDRLLNEIYFNFTNDDNIVRSLSAVNNSALKFAGDIALRGQVPASDAELHRQLRRVFFTQDFQPMDGGYQRLTEARLNLPIDDVLLMLDVAYTALRDVDAVNYNRLQDELRALANTHWYGHGIIPCQGIVGPNTMSPDNVRAIGADRQLAAALASVYDGETCLPEDANLATARELVGTEPFRDALRRVIRVRLALTTHLISLNRNVNLTRMALKASTPSVGLAVSSVALIGDALLPEPGAGWELADARPMKRGDGDTWTVTAQLHGGDVKFIANGNWQVNWGAQRPWDLDAAYMQFEGITLDPEGLFPAGTAVYGGLNIPTLPGRYRVSFDASSYAYRFERLDD